MLERLIPAPRLLEIDRAELAAPPDRVWQLLRHGNLASSPLVRALFALRTIPSRVSGQRPEATLRIDDLASSAERPGFQLLAEDAPREFAVGAIGKVWHLEIPFVHVDTADDFAGFAEPGFVKVAWSMRVNARGERDTRVEFELRVDATDDESWRKFKRYFRVIGPASHFIRRTLLASLERELGSPAEEEEERPLAGDALLSDARAQLTHGITIAAPAQRIWPWLVQMGCRRAGFYAIDLLDNAGQRSARELHPELMNVKVGQVLPATPEGDDGFEVLSIDPPHALVLGGLYSPEQPTQLPFAAARPERFWQVTWAFVLETLDAETTRLHVRARAAFPTSGQLHVAWIRPVHHLMQGAMLRHLRQRAEARLPRDDVWDVLEGLRGMAIMFAAFLSPFLRPARRHWGLDAEAAARSFPGDELVPEPRWGWTHAVEIAAPAASVWPWVAQIGADRAGFYSYQWLENLAGCNVRNAEVVHPEWQVRAGQELVLHPDPKAPRLRVVAVDPGRYVLARDTGARGRGEPWASVSWLFLVEPLGERRCRFISRYRADCSQDLATELSFGPTLLEPIGFAMDRRMLLGVKERSERARPSAPLPQPETESC